MALNTYFGNYMASGEQELVRSLATEAIKIYGRDVYYMPLTRTTYDEIFDESSIKTFNHAVAIEMYLETYDAFRGEGTSFGKFGLEIRDQMVFSVVKKRFEDTVENVVDIDRPREGDMIYFPLVKRVYVIQYVDYKPTLYVFDDLPTYHITCELLEYSGEIFNTGIKDVDRLTVDRSTDILLNGLYNESGDILMNENDDFLTYDDELAALELKLPWTDNEDFQDVSDDIVDFTDMNPLIDRTY